MGEFFFSFWYMMSYRYLRGKRAKQTHFEATLYSELLIIHFPIYVVSLIFFFHILHHLFKKMTEEKIEEKLMLLQRLGVLADWFKLPVYDYNRHHTWLRKQCLCQMLEMNLIKKKVITV